VGIRTLAILLALGFAAPARPGDPGVAARVNGVAISRERLERSFEDYLAERGRSVAAIRSPAAYEALHREALGQLVDAELLWQEAQRRGKVASAAEAEAALAEVRARFRRPGDFERRLERGGFTEASYTEHLRQQLSIRRLVQEEIVAGLSTSAEEARAEREASPARFAHLPEAEALAAARREVQDRKEREALERHLSALRAAATLELPRPR
jgi:hypothetical protein